MKLNNFLFTAAFFLTLTISASSTTENRVYIQNKDPTSGQLYSASFYWPDGYIGRCTAEVFQHTYQSRYKRPSTFYVNPNYDQDKQPTTYWYSHSGYDRGHIAPAGDFSWNEQAIHDSMYVTNISPQDSWTNQQPWRIIQESVRNFSQDSGIDLYIVTCTHGVSGHYNKLAIAEHYYKIVCQYDNGGQIVAFKADNGKTSTTDERDARKKDTEVLRDARDMLDLIGETFDPLGEFKNQGAFGDISQKCGTYKQLDQSKWLGLLDTIQNKQYEMHTVQEARNILQEGVPHIIAHNFGG